MQVFFVFFFKIQKCCYLLKKVFLLKEVLNSLQRNDVNTLCSR